MWFNYLKIRNKQTELKKSLDAILTWFKKHVTFIILNKFALSQEIPVTKAILTLKWITFVSSRKPYRIGILFLQEAPVWALFCVSADSCGDARKLSWKWLFCLYRIGFELLFVVAVYAIVPCTKIIIDPVKCEQRLDLPLVVSSHTVAQSPTSFPGSLSYPFSLGP